MTVYICRCLLWHMLGKFILVSQLWRIHKLTGDFGWGKSLSGDKWNLWGRKVLHLIWVNKAKAWEYAKEKLSEIGKPST